MTKWTEAQREKFRATMKAKREMQEIPLSAIPQKRKRKQHPKQQRKAGQQPQQRVNGVVQMHAEVDAKSGELSLVFGPLRVPLRVR